MNAQYEQWYNAFRCILYIYGEACIKCVVAAWAKQSKLSLLAQICTLVDCTCAAPSKNCEDRGEILSGKHAITILQFF